MQPQPTAYEQQATKAFQFLGQARMQCMMLHDSATKCIQKCLDTEELYTLLRTENAPIKYRLEKDLAEKKCVTNCGAKWDELFRRTVMNLNKQETQAVQFKAIEEMMSRGGPARAAA